MMQKSKLLLATGILLLCFSFTAFGQYADLVGKWATIKAPYNWPYIGLTYDEETCDKIISAYYSNDKRYFDNLLTSFDVLVIKNYTNVLVLDVKSFENKAKVTLLSGPYKGVSGWIPIYWLHSNEERPRFAQKKRWMVGKFKTPGLDHWYGGYIRRDKML